MFFKYDPKNFDQITDHFEENGFAVLTDVDPRLARALRAVITKVTGLTESQILGASQSEEPLSFSEEVRNELARPQVVTELREPLLEMFGDLVLRLLGPIVHISRDFHPQIKRGTQGVILKGYTGTGLEVEAAYGMHTDFTAGRVMTSPSAVVFWIPLNTCDQNGLRLYKKTNKMGLLTNRWLPPGTTGFDELGEHVDVVAKEGQVLIFNFTVLHGTALGGPRTRISADLRFFPFCGILDNPPYVLTESPVQWIRERIKQLEGETLLAPLYETLAYLGQPIDWPEVKKHSPLNWAKLIEADLARDPEGVRHALEMLVNTEQGFDPLSSYLETHSHLKLEPNAYESVIPKLEPEAQPLAEQVIAARRGA